MTFLICSTTSVRLITFLFNKQKDHIYIIHHSIYYKDKHNSLQKTIFLFAYPPETSIFP